MRSSFDRRVVTERILRFVRSCQERIPCHLAGGAALAGVYLAHRTTGDVDLFVHDPEDMRALVDLLDDVAAEADVSATIVRDAGRLVRARLVADGRTTELDIVHEPLDDLEAPPPPVEGVIVESLTDLRANKLTCVLSRSEPRDLVDLYFLDRAGHPPEEDLGLALAKDAGIDPGVLAWLLARFPVEPLPEMLLELSVKQLKSFRDSLAERFRRAALASGTRDGHLPP
jgi:hypothetical protein